MERPWRQRGLVGEEKIQAKTFQFIFAKSEDREAILRQRPWSFDSHFLVLQKREEEMDYEAETFNFTPIWVQIWNIPRHWVFREMGLDLREFIDEVKDAIVPDISDKKYGAGISRENKEIPIGHVVVEKGGYSGVNKMRQEEKEKVSTGKMIVGNEEKIRDDDILESELCGKDPFLEDVKTGADLMLKMYKTGTIPKKVYEEFMRPKPELSRHVRRSPFDDVMNRMWNKSELENKLGSEKNKGATVLPEKGQKKSQRKKRARGGVENQVFDGESRDETMVDGLDKRDKLMMEGMLEMQQEGCKKIKQNEVELTEGGLSSSSNVNTQVMEASLKWP
ncbi:OLC1v1017107C1 [Oldenlandia corymbosa var. corymbosa]|uniref:OLC1v1017107C1 n=1 Tax=Oldenlandia corymbosa var. corymbosa TaxID=529605 RepID=A0AAV1E8P6_OLDCO|nr:OLC1v1017107C1 [Oldenlandia corymbosa var. corymbosa]